MDTLYHYCSTENFVSIIKNQSIWLSSLSLSNDTMEGKLVNRTIARLAERDGLDATIVQRLASTIASFEEVFDALGFCLSEDGDLLSQWRGYARDATGVSIGFSYSYLEQTAKALARTEHAGFTIKKVAYSAEEQEAHLRPTYDELRKLISDGALKAWPFRMLLDTRTDEEIDAEKKQLEQLQKAFHWKLVDLFPHLYQLKHPAFREEREWRLISFVVPVAGDALLYRAGRDRVIPYREYELDLPGAQPITEVILGPKHLTPVGVVEDMLASAGYGKVKVRRSEATYR